MNWLLTGVFFVLILAALRGFYRGFLLMAYSLVSWILALLIVSCVSPVLAGNIMERTQIDENLEKVIVQQIDGREKNQNEPSQQTKASGLPEEALLGLIQAGGAGAEILGRMGVYDQIAEKLAAMIISGCTYIFVLLIVRILLAIAGHALKIVSKIQGIRQINRILGVVLGVSEGILVIWIVFGIFAVICVTDTGNEIIRTIYSSSILKMIYENNPLMAASGNFL